MKIALVTGASSGMGRETVIQLADRFGGLDEIWAVARRENRLEELEEEIPVRLRKFALDVTDEAQLEILRQALEAERPQVRILVNAAGYGKIGPVGSHCMEEETGMVAVNCQALVAITHMALPYMPDNSRIIQYASAAAFCPQPDFAVYAATKAFVLSFSRALGEELKGRNIAVTAVCPGPVKTEFFGLAETKGKIPFYKYLAMARPEKVVRTALRDSFMGRPVSVYGLLMKAFHAVSRICPPEIIFKIMNTARN